MAVPIPVNALTALKENTSAKKGRLVSPYINTIVVPAVSCTKEMQNMTAFFQAARLVLVFSVWVLLVYVLICTQVCMCCSGADVMLCVSVVLYIVYLISYCVAPFTCRVWPFCALLSGVVYFVWYVHAMYDCCALQTMTGILYFVSQVQHIMYRTLHARCTMLCNRRPVLLVTGDQCKIFSVFHTLRDRYFMRCNIWKGSLLCTTDVLCYLCHMFHAVLTGVSALSRCLPRVWW